MVCPKCFSDLSTEDKNVNGETQCRVCGYKGDPVKTGYEEDR